MVWLSLAYPSGEEGDILLIQMILPVQYSLHVQEGGGSRHPVDRTHLKSFSVLGNPAGDLETSSMMIAHAAVEYVGRSSLVY
jgi:hypothetical protein